MTLEYRVTTLPAVWPQRPTPAYARKRAPFKTIWSSTLDLLGREVRMLNGKNVQVAVDVDDYHLRVDGQLRANARPRSPAVIVSFDTREGRLAFPCDTFAFWQDNVGAIARALEDLRRVDRYGVRKGAQYTGFKALPATTVATLSASEAARVLGEFSDRTAVAVLASVAQAKESVRIARGRSHPDRLNGNHAAWDQVAAAISVLQAHFGVPLT